MELNFGADFDEDLFDVKPQRKSNDRSEDIKNYRPKQVQSRTFFNETPTILEDIANSFKLKGDLEYYSRNFQAALEFYEKSFEISRKSTSLNETIFQRELAESRARCLLKLTQFEDSVKAVQKLEESSVNFEQYTTSLNLHLSILEEVKRSKKNDDKGKAMIATILCKLVLMHPMSSNLWQKLTESFIELDLAELASNAFSFVKELAKFSPNSTNEIYVRNRLNVNSWIEAKANVISSMLKSEEESFKNSENVSYTPLNERLEKLDKWEDNHKLKVAHQFDDFKMFFTLF